MNRYQDVKTLIRDIDRLSTQASVNRSMSEAAAKWDIAGFIPFETISFDEGSYEYIPENREYSMADPTPMTCRSNPSYTDDAPQQPIRIFTYKHELALNVCFMECGPDSLATKLNKKHNQIGMGFGHLNWNLLWNGYPDLGIYGIVNHPMANNRQKLLNGTGGNTTWASKTPEEIVRELILLAWDFEDPVFSMSQNAYWDAFGKSYGGDTCNSIITCINRILNSMRGVSFDLNDINIVEGLNGHDPAVPAEVLLPHHNFGTLLDNNTNATEDTTQFNFITCHDRGAMRFRASNMVPMGAGMSENTKYAKAIRAHASQGLIIDKTDSVRVRWGL